MHANHLLVVLCQAFDLAAVLAQVKLSNHDPFNVLQRLSDFPFGDPKCELSKIKGLQLPSEQEEALLGGNLKRLLAPTFPPSS